MSKIIGNTTATPVPRSDWAQVDPNKVDFILNKPELGKLSEKDIIEKSDLAAGIQTSLGKADAAEAYIDEQVAEVKKYTDEAIANVASASHNHDDRYYTEAEVDTKLDLKADFSTVSSNYNESIIGLSVDGQVVTYIKGDGSTHTFTTQDTDTTYSLATDEVTGLTKLYATTGNAEDGTMTQRAIKTELDKKVGVTIDDSSNTLIFTI